MSAIICTLFEGVYHLGLGALLNSLHTSGYRGQVWAGYRGPLPPWASAAVQAADGTASLKICDGLEVCFTEVKSARHLTNYKPEFMLEIWEQRASEAGSIFYFDPDIVVRGAWSFFEEWAGGGIALCEDVNSPVHSSHPLRKQWCAYYAPHGFTPKRLLDVYVNGGFQGVSRANRSFLELWARLQLLMEPAAGGLRDWGIRDRTFLFNKTDQDALNIAAMFTECDLSIAGKEAMDLAPGGYLMSHALGSPKPWAKKFVRHALAGVPPTPADKSFWSNVAAPLPLYSPEVIKSRQREIRLASAVGRFMTRK